MVLKKILLAFQPPGLGLVYVENNEDIIKHINLPELNENTNINELTNKIIQKESVDISHWDAIRNGIAKIQENLVGKKKFRRSNETLVHLLPITNVAISNNGDCCCTGSYDRTVKVWDVPAGVELQCLEGHNNVVICVTFNKNGYKDDKDIFEWSKYIPIYGITVFCINKRTQVLTGSFDGTAKIWDMNTGQCTQTFWGHTSELVLAKYLPNENTIATASTDTTIRIYQTETAQELFILSGHTKDIISLEIDYTGNYIVSGSFDKTIRIWDARVGSVKVLCGHEAEISSCKINTEGTLLVSGSFDGRAILWDLRQLKYYKIFPGSMSEVLDVDLKGSLIAACTGNGTAYVWDFINESRLWELQGHEKTVTKVCFNPVEDEIITCSEDRTIRVWNLATAKLTNHTLEHEDGVFTCVYSRCGTTILSACKDNSCTLWFKN